MNKNVQRKIYIGPMFSGKSTELIRLIRREKAIDNNILVIKPLIDKRYSEDHVCSHDYDKVQCVTTKELKSTKSIKDWNNIKVIFIDEAQFFKGLYDFVVECLEVYNKSVVIVGLDGDYKREPFGDILRLIPLSDEVKKLTAYCHFCKDGTPGIFTLRMTNDDKQELVGGSDIYRSVCRHHYLLLNKMKSANTCTITC